MINETFEKMVWKMVQGDKEKVMVVDNHHAYGIIKDRMDSFWEQVRLQQPDEDQIMVLGGLIALAAYAQLAAEDLSLVPEQLGRDESADAAEKEADDVKQFLRGFMDMLERNKQPIKPLQKNIKRFALEFDAVTLENWRNQVREIA